MSGPHDKQIVPATSLVAASLHDTNTIPPTRGVYVGGAGNLKVTTAAGEDVTLSGVLAGTVLPISVIRLWNTGTTATLITAMY